MTVRNIIILKTIGTRGGPSEDGKKKWRASCTIKYHVSPSLPRLLLRVRFDMHFEIRLWGSKFLTIYALILLVQLELEEVV